ncbi:MAG: hypothetical protein GXP38_03720 [Chloroflexi bacterium]|nr:hypothetical protein [Chloroflexota bacterium]
MHTVIPLILRLLVDPAQPQVLRGTVQTLEQDEPHPFSSEQELIFLLHELIAPTHPPPQHKK